MIGSLRRGRRGRAIDFVYIIDGVLRKPAVAAVIGSEHREVGGGNGLCLDRAEGYGNGDGQQGRYILGECAVGAYIPGYVAAALAVACHIHPVNVNRIMLYAILIDI